MDTTREEYEKALAIVEKYNREQLLASRIERGNNSKESPMPKEYWAVHEGHCCLEHGCKYGDDNCPVALGLTKQKSPCESCEDDRFFESII